MYNLIGKFQAVWHKSYSWTNGNISTKNSNYCWCWKVYLYSNLKLNLVLINNCESHISEYCIFARNTKALLISALLHNGKWIL